MNPIKLVMGKIDYINASPVYYGLDNGLLPDWAAMVEGPPAVLNKMIKNGEIQLSPVSAAFYALNHRELLVLPDLSISCNGTVLSVILASHYPVEDLDGRTVVFTADSATAVNLMKLVFSKNRISPRLVTRKIYHMASVPQDADAVLVIGDAALTQPWETRFRYRIDLGELWKAMTGLPFVFALWVVRKSFADLHPDMVAEMSSLFLKSRTSGDASMDIIIQAGAVKLGLDQDVVRRYYDFLFCDLDPPKIKAAENFFSSLHQHGLLSEPVKLEFFRH